MLEEARKVILNSEMEAGIDELTAAYRAFPGWIWGFLAVDLGLITTSIIIRASSFKGMPQAMANPSYSAGGMTSSASTLAAILKPLALPCT